MRKEIGARLLHIRAARTQPEMAAVMGVSPRTYAYYEQGQRTPDSEALIPLFAEGWNINWLLTGEGPQRWAADHSQQKLDQDTLRSAIETVESALDLAGVPFSARGRAELVEAIYRHLVKKQLSTDTVAQALRMIREAINANAKSD